MSNALAIAGVTAVMKDLLDSGMIDHAVTDAMGRGVTVSAVAPDTIDLTGSGVTPRLNLFLYQASPNPSLRNDQLPSRDARGRRLNNPPLALDLHYLVTAYGVDDLESEVLLGYAMQLLHETPVLAREAIRRSLNPPEPVTGSLLPTVYQALRAADLADQFEPLRITPAPLDSEQMSRLWSAFQVSYRPTTAYQVSVVLIESRQAARAPLPVLTRGGRDPVSGRELGVAVQAGLSSPVPVIERLVPPDNQVAVSPGDTLEVQGQRLAGSNREVIFSLPRLDVEQAVTPLPGDARDHLGLVSPDLPVGSYLLAARLIPPGETDPRETNQLPLLIAPRITTPLPASVTRSGTGEATITLACSPAIRPGQQASLLLGTLEIPAEPIVTETASLTFVVPDAPPGDHLVRLRVDGIDSQAIDRSVNPPVFFDHRITIS